MQVRFLEAGDVRIRFEATCLRLGEASRLITLMLSGGGLRSSRQGARPP